MQYVEPATASDLGLTSGIETAQQCELANRRREALTSGVVFNEIMDS